MSNLVFIDKVKSNQSTFADRVKEIARKYSFNPNWLMGVMNSETGGTFSPSIKNMAGSGAVGLIQFMPDTANRMGISTYELERMNAVQQLSYVDKYIGMTLKDRKKERPESFEDLYLLVFYPAAINKPDTYTFPNWVYAQNAGMDVNRDGKISIEDFKQWILKLIPEQKLPEFTSRYRYLKYAIFIGISLVVVFLIWWYLKETIK